MLRETRVIIGLLGLILVVAGYFGPWIPHESTALLVTGLELAEFAKFFPQAQSALVVRAFFYLPLIGGMILLSLFAGRACNRLFRWAVALGGSFLLLLMVLPYAVVEGARHALATGAPFALSLSYARQLILLAAGMLLTLLAPLSGSLPRRTRLALALALVLVSVIPALYQFLRFRPLVSALYGTPVGIGWGVGVCAMGFALLLVSAVSSVGNPKLKI